MYSVVLMLFASMLTLCVCVKDLLNLLMQNNFICGHMGVKLPFPYSFH